MNETTSTWKIQPRPKPQGQNQPSRRFTLSIEARSLHRPDYVYRWSADAFIDDTGHTDIKDVVLRAIKSRYTIDVPQDIRKHFEFPQNGTDNVEPEYIESACKALADTYYAKTQVAEFTHLKKMTTNEDNTRRVQRAQDIMASLASR